MHPLFGNVPTLTTSILSTASLWAQGYQPKVNGGFDARLGNSVRYDTPNMSGFTSGIQYSTGEGTPRSNAGIWSMNVVYNNGPIQVGAAYERNNSIRAAGLTDQALTIAGGYNFGVFRIGGVWERLDYDTPTGSLERDFWGVGGTVNAGPGQLYLFWGLAQDGEGGAANGTRVGGLAKGDNTSSQQYEVSYTYPLSKRTLTYAGYVKIKNDSNANYTFNINRTLLASAASRRASCSVRSTSSKRSESRSGSNPDALRTGAFGRPFFFDARCGMVLVRWRHARCPDHQLRPRVAHAGGASFDEPPGSGRNAARAGPVSRGAAPRSRTDARQSHREVCAQALYAAQALVARDPRIREDFAQAAREEEEHLAWTHRRLVELDDRSSLLNPLWYAGSFAIGVAAGVAGDRVNLGFVVENRASGRGPPDRPHGPAAARGREKPGHRRADACRRGAPRGDGAGRGRGRPAGPVRGLMRVAADVMRTVAYRI